VQAPDTKADLGRMRQNTRLDDSTRNLLRQVVSLATHSLPANPPGFTGSIVAQKSVTGGAPHQLERATDGFLEALLAGKFIHSWWIKTITRFRPLKSSGQMGAEQILEQELGRRLANRRHSIIFSDGGVRPSRVSDADCHAWLLYRVVVAQLRTIAPRPHRADGARAMKGHVNAAAGVAAALDHFGDHVPRTVRADDERGVTYDRVYFVDFVPRIGRTQNT